LIGRVNSADAVAMERMAAAHRMDSFLGCMGFYLFLVLGWDWMGNGSVWGLRSRQDHRFKSATSILEA